MKKLTNEHRSILYNSYEGHCAFCGGNINYKEMIACCITGYHLPSCKTCYRSSHTHDLDSFRDKIEQAIKHFYNSGIGGLIHAYGGLNVTLTTKVVFYFEREENKSFLHTLSMKERMKLVLNNVTQQELIDLYRTPGWCNKEEHCNKWLNLKIFNYEDCNNCQFILKPKE